MVHTITNNSPCRPCSSDRKQTCYSPPHDGTGFFNHCPGYSYSSYGGMGNYEEGLSDKKRK